MPLHGLLGPTAVRYLAANLGLFNPHFDRRAFQREALRGLEPLSILQRGQHLAKVLRTFLAPIYSEAIAQLLASLTEPLAETEGNGLGVFFYLPHVCFVAEYGLDATGNDGRDPFDVSMHAQYELTRRFSAEFSIRPFLIQAQRRTLNVLQRWVDDADPHVRRLCSEGTRPRLPWAIRVPALITDPRPVLPILEALKDDTSLYVRRSVANHIGDLAKDHPQLAFELCERWLEGASAGRRWLIRHALRHPAKHGNKQALRLRAAASG